ncbi:MAG: ASKHA domain-containing protein [Gammaproteobacteria bacterium]|nr:ASKHA domain-containing protein [Gammaproteobacteria bacterium]
MDKSGDTAKVVFSPSGRRGVFHLGIPLLEAARELGVDIDSVCGGRGLCGRCQITCTEGRFPKLGITSKQEHLSPFSATEQKYGERKTPLDQGRRLSCQAAVRGDLLIDVPPESQIHRQLVRKEAEQRDITLDPVVHLHYVEVQEADMHEPRSDMTRLVEALSHQWGFTDLKWRLALLDNIQPALREGGWSVTAAIHQGREIIALWPGYKDVVYGLAIDVGSTTIAAHLCDLGTGEVISSDGMMNPQIRFGEDLMSRVSYVMMHPEGAEEMTGAVREGINRLIGQITNDTGISPLDIVSITVAGNPIMHHLLLGISPVELGAAPFALAVDSSVYVDAGELDIDINPGGIIYILPCIAGHVGADTAGVILSEQPHVHDDVSLLIDIGTNAEIVLGNRERLLACSSPTGPAFEGAQISCGQRAAPGAIERVRIDPDTLDPRIKVIGSDLWSDDSGLAASDKPAAVTGICGSGIIEVLAEMYLCGILTSDGMIDGRLKDNTDRIIEDGRTFSYILYRGESTISVTQNDIRQIQLAKAALYAGVKLLMDRMGITSVDRIRLAGAFGSHIDVRLAMVLGMIPDCPLQQVASVGNAAGTGARIALLNNESREEIETVVRKIEKIETAVETKFQEYFVNAMAIPHKTDSFPNLEKVVTLPEVDKDSRRTTSPQRRKRTAKA